MHVIGTIILLGLSLSTLGQSLSRQGLNQDLFFLQQAVNRGHSATYLQRDTVSLIPFVDSLNAGNGPTWSPVAYRLAIGSALQQIGCVHTSVVKNPVTEHHPSFYFPLATCLLQQKLFVSIQPQTSQGYEGQEIVAINGVPVGKIIGALLNYAASDGGGQAFADRYINRASSSLLAFYFNYPTQYQLQFSNQRVVLAATPAPVASRAPSIAGDRLLSNKGNQLTQPGPATALLTIQSFSRSDVRFIKRAFSAISRAGTSSLILDLRGNTGGNRTGAVALAKHVVTQPFSYTILQPSLKPGPYLNPVGRLYLLLSRLKYHVGHLYGRHRTELGTEFSYRYRPAKTSYQGQLYVLTDGFTASSATMVTSWIRQHTSAIFVGSQASGGYNGNNGGSFPAITLPYSKMQIRFPVYRLILDKASAQRSGLVPDYALPYTIEDVLGNRDKEIDFVLTELAK